jgi:hypothetical protein
MYYRLYIYFHLCFRYENVLLSLPYPWIRLWCCLFARRSAESAAAVVDRTCWRTHSAVYVNRIVPMGAPYTSYSIYKNIHYLSVHSYMWRSRQRRLLAAVLPPADHRSRECLWNDPNRTQALHHTERTWQEILPPRHRKDRQGIETIESHSVASVAHDQPANVSRTNMMGFKVVKMDLDAVLGKRKILLGDVIDEEAGNTDHEERTTYQEQEHRYVGMPYPEHIPHGQHHQYDEAACAHNHHAPLPIRWSVMSVQGVQHGGNDGGIRNQVHSVRERMRASMIAAVTGFDKGRRMVSRRTGTLRALLAGVQIGRTEGTTGLDESRPDWGLRQQRRVHALFGRAGHRSLIDTYL